MKLKILIFTLLVNLISFTCSKDESDKENETLSRCFVVKDIHTNIPIFNARVNLQEKLESDILGGYMFWTFATGNTDVNGEVCITFNNIIDRIESVADGYTYFHIDNPPFNYSEIYLNPITN